jgi:hypothetical protein
LAQCVDHSNVDVGFEESCADFFQHRIQDLHEFDQLDFPEWSWQSDMISELLGPIRQCTETPKNYLHLRWWRWHCLKIAMH